MSIRSRLVSQPNNKVISNNEQFFDARDLFPITFGIILPLNPGVKYLNHSEINMGTEDENFDF